MQTFVDKIDSPVFFTTARSAEMLKFVNNSFHALKVSFANEIDRICHSMDIDGSEVMSLVCEDTKLNISPNYLTPGSAFGGPCLPKDLTSLQKLAEAAGVKAELLQATLTSNLTQIEDSVENITGFKINRIGLIGLTFKYGTNDVRHSPFVDVAKSLVEQGYDLRIFDSNISSTKLIGANAQWLNSELPEFDEIFCDSMDELLEHADLVTVAHSEYLEDDDLRKQIDTKPIVFLYKN